MKLPSPDQKFRLYCGQLTRTVPPREVTLWNFYNSIFVARLAVAGDIRTVYEVNVSLWDGPEEEALYWGWWDAKREEYAHIYYAPFMVKMCFPYGTDIEEKNGKGKLVPLTVDVVRTVPEDEKDEQG